MNKDSENLLETIKMFFDSAQISRDKKNIELVCPECKKQKNTVKKKLQLDINTTKWHCWSCGVAGLSIRSFFLRFAKKGLLLLKDITDNKLTERTTCDDKHVTLPECFVPLACYESYSRDDHFMKYAEEALFYLKNVRKLCDSDLYRHRLGIAPIDQFMNRIIFPSFDANGDLNYYSCRSFIKSQKYNKYYNCNNKKNAIIFNEIDINWSDELLLVEGPFDLIKCDCNATALLGSSMTEDTLLFEKIVLNNTPVTLMLDPDARLKMLKIAQLLHSFAIDVNMVYLCNKDPGEMSRDEILNELTKKVKYDPMTAILSKIQC